MDSKKLKVDYEIVWMLNSDIGERSTLLSKECRAYNEERWRNEIDKMRREINNIGQEYISHIQETSDGHQVVKNINNNDIPALCEILRMADSGLRCGNYDFERCLVYIVSADEIPF